MVSYMQPLLPYTSGSVKSNLEVFLDGFRFIVRKDLKVNIMKAHFSEQRLVYWGMPVV